MKRVKFFATAVFLGCLVLVGFSIEPPDSVSKSLQIEPDSLTAHPSRFIGKYVELTGQVKPLLGFLGIVNIYALKCYQSSKVLIVFGRNPQPEPGKFLRVRIYVQRLLHVGTWSVMLYREKDRSIHVDLQQYRRDDGALRETNHTQKNAR